MGNAFTSSSSYSLLEQENIVESILFMMGESVSVDTLAIAIESTVDVAKEAAERLYNKYQNEYQDRGMKVIKLGTKYQMVSNNKYFKNLVLVASHPQKPVITESILETLSIIAYKQPITKPEIEDIRGVKSDYAVNRLLEYGLIEEKGRLETAGRPIQFGTTEEFMLRFGIESLDDLPILDATKFAEIQTEVEKELTESLGEPVVIDKDKYASEVTNNFKPVIEPEIVNNTPSETNNADQNVNEKANASEEKINQNENSNNQIVNTEIKPEESLLDQYKNNKVEDNADEYIGEDDKVTTNANYSKTETITHNYDENDEPHDLGEKTNDIGEAPR